MIAALIEFWPDLQKAFFDTLLMVGVTMFFAILIGTPLGLFLFLTERGGLAEAPSMGVGTVNIGDRQKGRLQASSVINCAPDRGAIRVAIELLYSQKFRTALPDTVNPYGNGGASEQIARILQNHPLDGLLKKSFHDLVAPPAGASPTTIPN